MGGENEDRKCQNKNCQWAIEIFQITKTFPSEEKYSYNQIRKFQFGVQTSRIPQKIKLFKIQLTTNKDATQTRRKLRGKE